MISRRWILGGVVGLALVMTGCGGSDSSSSTTEASAAIPLTAQDFAFSPTSLSVTPGASVSISFTNSGAVTHSLTIDSGPSVSVDANAGSTPTITFTAPAQPGTLSFHCRFHSSMIGTITVGVSHGAASTIPPSSSGGGGRYTPAP